MSKLDTLKKDLSIEVHLPERVVTRGNSTGILQATDTRNTFIIQPAHHNDEDILDDMDTVMPPAVSEEPIEPERTTRRRSKKGTKSPETTSTDIDVVASIHGFGDIPTSYMEFDIGEGCLHIALGKSSWIPPRATRNDTGQIHGFSFDRTGGRIYVNVGLGYTHNGIQHIILIELNQETQDD